MVRRQLNIEDRGRAIAWLQGGNTQRNVAVRFGVSQSVVGRLWQRFQATNSVRNRPRSGRPRSTTNREDRYMYITNMALRQRTTTARRLRDNLRTATGTRVSDQTICNRLRANNLRCRRQAVRPPLLPRHRTPRRHWCTLHLQWGRVMFTYESRFSIQFNYGRVRVYRRPGECFADINVRQRHRFGGGSVMVWGGISNHQLGRRVRNNHAPPANLHDMGQLLMAELQAIPQEFFRRLINNMRQRCVECIRARGGFTRY